MIREISQPAPHASRPMQGYHGLTVVVPAYNEENGIEKAIDTLVEALQPCGWEYEIIVVDDGSSDRTAELAEGRGVQVVRSETNRGYGDSLKAGIAMARYDWVAIIDADGTYPASEIPRMLERVPAGDMIVGARIGWQVHNSPMRMPAKWLLRKFASYLAGQEIPDLNSGLRVIRKSLVDEFAHILPPGFSFTTTITLALISTGRSVSYIPIDYYKRVGQSKIRPTHAFTFAFLILRTMMLFQPLRVLGPLALLFMLVGLGKTAYEFFSSNVSSTGFLIALQGVFILSLGLLADQNARFHRARR